MKKVFSAAVFLMGVSSAQAATLTCDYSSISILTGDETKYPVSIELNGDEGATKPLQVGKFGQYDVEAWQLYGQIVISAKLGVPYFSTTSEGKANLRLQTEEAIYETFCRVEGATLK